ncbi:MAG: UbiA family prenyltransferase [Candidatus Methanomethylicaceae archaeon]|nr:UbiA family prenyltransferase [Candidatus Verstraetearchaeota archaeon]
MKLWKSIHDYIILIRPINSIMMGLAVIVGEITTINNIPKINDLIFGFLVGFFLTAKSMVLNDIVDIEIDKINAPNRPLPSGRISIESAKNYAIILIILGIFFSYIISINALLLAISAFSISIIYNFKGKKTGFIGNLMVAYCVAIPFLFGGIVVSNTINEKILIFFILALLTTTGREIIKGIADVEGDKIKGIKTLALKYGERKAAIIAIIFYLIAVAITPIPIIKNIVGFWYILLIIIVDFGFIYSSIKIMKKQNKETALEVKKESLFWMLIALLAFLIDGILKVFNF